MRETSDNNKDFTCPMCGSKFGSQQAVDRHKQEDHSDPSTPPRHYR
jgi:transcription elongation factor Elf1